MFDSGQKSTGTGYTGMVALLTKAFLFAPAVLAASRPAGYVSLSLVVACGLCVILAWVHWTKFSRLTIASLAIRRER